MDAWQAVVDLLRALVFSAAHLAGGSLGTGVLATSLAVRLALLPLTLRTARRIREHQQRVRALEPELARLRHRHANDRARLADATLELYRRNGIALVPRGMWSSLLIQAPIGTALYQAVSQGLGRGVRFLWIRDLASPDLAIAAAAGALAGFAATGGESGSTRVAFVINAALTFALAWRLSATVGLYWLTSSAVSAAQTILLRPSNRAAPAP